MKKLFLAALSLAALLTTGLISSCGEGSDNKGKEVSGVDKEIKTPVKESKELKIAYIDMDSINSNYKFSKDVEAMLKAKESAAQTALKAKEASAQSSLKAKASAFQTRAAKFQSDFQSNKITSQAQYEKEQNALAKMQQDLQETEAKLSGDYQAEAAKLSEEYQNLLLEHSQAINDTSEHFLSLYGEEKGYDFIFGKSKASGSVLYSKPSYDVTDEVITALNKRYEQYKK